MIPKDVYEFWRQQSEIYKKTAGINQQEIASIGNRLKNLFSTQSADDIRKNLANADRSYNARCAWILLAWAQDMIDFNSPAGGEALNLIEWTLLISRYSDESSVLAGHGSLLKGMLMHNVGNLPAARDAYRDSTEAYKALPESKGALGVCAFCLAQLYADLNEIQQAHDYYNQALASAPADDVQGEKWRRLVTLYMDTSNKKSQLLSHLLELPSSKQWVSEFEKNKSIVKLIDFVEMAKNRAFQQVTLERYSEANRAAALVDGLLAFRGDAPSFQSRLADYYLQQNEFTQAETVIRAVLEGKAGDKELLFKLSRSLIPQGKLVEGVQVLEKLIQAYPDYGAAHSFLGQIYANEKQWGPAKEHLEIALKIDPDDVMAKQFLTFIPKAEVVYDPKTKQLSIIGDVNSMSPQDLGEAMMAALIVGDPQHKHELLKSIVDEKGEAVAKRVESRVMAQSGYRQLTHLQAAEELFAKKKFLESVGEYKLAIEENPEDWQAYMGLGDAYFMTGEFNLAAVHFEESVTIHPYAPTYRYLGDAYLRTGQIDEAIKAYQNSVNTDPSYWPAKAALQIALDMKAGRG